MDGKGFCVLSASLSNRLQCGLGKLRDNLSPCQLHNLLPIKDPFCRSSSRKGSQRRHYIRQDEEEEEEALRILQKGKYYSGGREKANGSVRLGVICALTVSE